MTAFIISQIFSGIAFVLLVISFWQKKKAKMFAFQVADSVFDGIHFCLLGGWSGGIVNFIGIVRSLVFMAKEKYKKLNNIFIYLLFVTVYCLVCYFTWNGWMSILPTLGVLVFTTALWFGNPKMVRIFGLVASCFWLSYDVCVMSYVEITTESILMLSTIISIIKLDIIWTKVLRKNDSQLEIENNKEDDTKNI